MTESRPFPMHVPTLTEVVEEPPIPDVAEPGGVVDAVVVDHDMAAADVPLLDQVVIEGESAPATAPSVAVLTDVVAESELLPPVEALLDSQDLSDSERMLAAAESGALTPELADQLTDQITENMNAAMRPFIEGLAQQMAQTMQEEFAQRLRAMVSQAVVQELNKRRL